MKTILLIFTLFIERCFSTDNLETTLNHCCNVGKIWSTDKKSCTITLPYPMANVPNKHYTTCSTTVEACCSHSLREMRCNEGKKVGLENGICKEKTHLEKNKSDYKMCCEMCKIGISVGSEETNCQTTLLFYNHQWGDVFQSCCSTAITRKKSFSTKIKKKTDSNPCIDGTHNCTSHENCVITLNGFECHPHLLLPLPMSIYPENLTKYNKKKDNCDIGYAYNAYEQKCKDIDECIEQPCEINELCENKLGSYECHCKTGFQLDKVTHACTDINECQLNLHTCQESQRCDNTVGSYQCVRFTGCGTGYTLDVESALCKDDDECELRTDACGILGPDWICRNTLGSFRCEKKRCTGLNCKVLQSSINSTMKLIQDNQSTVKCPRGYEVDNNNKCTDIDECKSPTQCLRNEVCINTNGNYYCLPKSKN